MATQPVQPDGIPVLGMYTPAYVVTGGTLVLCSGVLGVDADGETVGKGDAEAQARQAFTNLRTVLEAAGATLDDVVRVRIYSTDMANRGAINTARRDFFSPPYPASTHVESSRLVDPEWLVEIEAEAVIAAGR